MSEAPMRPSVVPLIWYDKPRAAIDWLQKAFGFEAVMVVSGADEGVIHSELTFGNGAVYVVGPSSAEQGGATPHEVGGRNTQSVCMNLIAGLDAHCETARAGGAKIQREPADQPYGDRVYTCLDPEGHSWAFAQPARAMTPEEMARATGRKSRPRSSPMAERSVLSSAPCYRDPKAALKFLEAAFGFETVMLIEDDQGNLVHSEMRFDDALIMIGYEWTEDHKSPASIGGKNTQTINIHIATDVDAHCARARAAGFDILMEPATQFYGDRTYRCRDPEGHIWTVGQTVQVVSREEAAAASGLKIEGWV